MAGSSFPVFLHDGPSLAAHRRACPDDRPAAEGASAGTTRPTLSTRLRIWTKTLQFPPSPRGLEEAPNALAATTGGPVEPSPILATVRRSLPRHCLLDRKS